MSELNAYELACRETCEWCAKWLDGDRTTTGALRSRPQPVHKVYPPHVARPFSEYLPCTAPTLLEWALQRHAKAVELETALRPFAHYAEVYALDPDKLVLGKLFSSVAVHGSHFVAACAALEGKSSSKTCPKCGGSGELEVGTAKGGCPCYDCSGSGKNGGKK